MKTSLRPATKADKERFDQLQQYGCICCRVRFQQRVPPDIHHLLSGGYRISHQHTIPLCEWHHRGVPPNPLSAQKAEHEAGPSLALNKKKFNRIFGTEFELLKKVNEALEKCKH